MKRKNLHNVNDAHAHAEDHVHDTEDDRQLHFVRVEEYYLVLGQYPARVHAHGIRRLHLILIRRQGKIGYIGIR